MFALRSSPVYPERRSNTSPGVFLLQPWRVVAAGFARTRCWLEYKSPFSKRDSALLFAWLEIMPHKQGSPWTRGQRGQHAGSGSLHSIQACQQCTQSIATQESVHPYMLDDERPSSKRHSIGELNSCSIPGRCGAAHLRQGSMGRNCELGGTPGGIRRML